MLSGLDDLRAAGDDIREQVMGLNPTVWAPTDDPIIEEFRDIINVVVFGTLWARPGLDMKTRTLVCVITDAATGQSEELAFHLQHALRQGWTKTELLEVLYQMIGYVGAPRIRGATRTASKVFADWDEES